MVVKFLPAYNGDSILITFKDQDRNLRTILIDGGTPATYNKTLKSVYNELETDIDLLVVTHIDDDHIGGIKKLFEDNDIDITKIKKVWFNSGGLLNHYFGEDEDKARAVTIVPNDIVDMSPDQGNKLEAKLDELEGVWVKKIIKQYDTIDFFGATITILSPNDETLKRLNEMWETEVDIQVQMSGAVHDDFEIDIETLIERPFKEDKGIPNGSSIAFLIEYKTTSGLLLGDAYPSVIVESLQSLGYSTSNKLKLDFVKISHHASKGNTSPELLDIIACKKYIISTNGLKHGLPDKEAIARIIASQKDCTLYYTYDDFIHELFTPNDADYVFENISLKEIDYTLKF
jgi:beta-lactamase superfamily II metal-dependent hydrolase